MAATVLCVCRQCNLQSAKRSLRRCTAIAATGSNATAHAVALVQAPQPLHQVVVVVVAAVVAVAVAVVVEVVVVGRRSSEQVSAA